jgi:hypothetical protein
MNGHIRERCAGHVERTQPFIRFSAERLRSTIRREHGTSMAAQLSRDVSVREMVSIVKPR